MILALSLMVLSGVVLWVWQRASRYRRMAAKFPGPRAYPLVGNAFSMGPTTVEFTSFLEKNCKKYFGSSYSIWVGNSVYIIVSDPKDIELILSSNKLLDKGEVYKFLHPWLGSGLLTSTGPKWRKHRKILTPTFHFKILEEFIDVFNANGAIMVENLKKEVDGPGFDIHAEYMALCTLDNIAETAMGVKINAQTDRDSEYVKAVRNMSDVTLKRSTKPWLGFDFIFNCSRFKRIQDESLMVLHTTTNNVIKTRKEEIIKERASRDVTKSEDDVSQSDGVKKRLAFLDMLIESTFNGSELTDEDIREEVDTFMFEGHDTTASGISFALWLLSWNQDVQEKVFQELEEVFPDPEAPLTFRGLQELKYMERVLKESQRLYPSVPIFARHLTEDLKLTGDLIAPKGAMVTVAAFMSHRNPDIFPDPDRFDPDRFLPDNVQGRHPYAYVPFSAGPRNCIGQKFAMLEMKSTIGHMLRAYKLVPGTDKPDLVLSAELVLMSTSGVTVKIVARNK